MAGSGLKMAGSGCKTAELVRRRPGSVGEQRVVGCPLQRTFGGRGDRGRRSRNRPRGGRVRVVTGAVRVATGRRQQDPFPFLSRCARGRSRGLTRRLTGSRRVSRCAWECDRMRSRRRVNVARAINGTLLPRNSGAARVPGAAAIAHHHQQSHAGMSRSPARRERKDESVWTP